MSRRFDAIVIGAGQAGPPMAGRLAKAGKTVAVIERKLLGGTCVNVGCTPTKTLVASAYAAHLARLRSNLVPQRDDRLVAVVALIRHSSEARGVQRGRTSLGGREADPPALSPRFVGLASSTAPDMRSADIAQGALDPSPDVPGFCLVVAEEAGPTLSSQRHYRLLAVPTPA